VFTINVHRFNNTLTLMVIFTMQWMIKAKIVIIVRIIIASILRFAMQVLRQLISMIRVSHSYLAMWDVMSIVAKKVVALYNPVLKISSGLWALLSTPLQNYEAIYKFSNLLVYWGPWFKFVLTPGFIIGTVFCYYFHINPLDHLMPVLKVTENMVTFFLTGQRPEYVVPVVPVLVDTAVGLDGPLREPGWYERILYSWYYRPYMILDERVPPSTAFMDNFIRRSERLAIRQEMWRTIYRDLHIVHNEINPIVRTYSFDQNFRGE